MISFLPFFLSCSLLGPIGVSGPSISWQDFFITADLTPGIRPIQSASGRPSTVEVVDVGDGNLRITIQSLAVIFTTDQTTVLQKSYGGKISSVEGVDLELTQLYTETTPNSRFAGLEYPSVIVEGESFTQPKESHGVPGAVVDALKKDVAAGVEVDMHAAYRCEMKATQVQKGLSVYVFAEFSPTLWVNP